VTTPSLFPLGDLPQDWMDLDADLGDFFGTEGEVS